jgi:hypothetical protein
MTKESIGHKKDRGVGDEGMQLSGKAPILFPESLPASILE